MLIFLLPVCEKLLIVKFPSEQNNFAVQIKHLMRFMALSYTTTKTKVQMHKKHGSTPKSTQ